MYPITCAGGYPMPIKVGRFDILGVSITGSDITSDSRITIADDDSFACVTDTDAVKPTLVDLQGKQLVGVLFDEPIKTRNGINITNLTNAIAGKVMVYIR